MINLDRRGPDPWNGFAIRTSERALSVGERGREDGSQSAETKNGEEWARNKGRHERFGSLVLVRSGSVQPGLFMV